MLIIEELKEEGRSIIRRREYNWRWREEGQRRKMYNGRRNDILKECNDLMKKLYWRENENNNDGRNEECLESMKTMKKIYSWRNEEEGVEMSLKMYWWNDINYDMKYNEILKKRAEMRNVIWRNWK